MPELAELPKVPVVAPRIGELADGRRHPPLRPNGRGSGRIDSRGARRVNCSPAASRGVARLEWKGRTWATI
jgi:hypothetical protein